MAAHGWLSSRLAHQLLLSKYRLALIRCDYAVLIRSTVATKTKKSRLVVELISTKVPTKEHWWGQSRAPVNREVCVS